MKIMVARIKDKVWSVLHTTRIDTTEKVIYLTFDDGPEPDITEFVLDQLKKYNAHATFFCCGCNIEKYPRLYDMLLKDDHKIASHTMNHIKGEEASLWMYLKEIKVFRQRYNTNLLRPPYGSLSRIQSLLLPLWGYKIILWSDDSTDWYHNENIDLEDIKLKLQVVSSGSIVLFHFCQKHEHRTRIILPQFLEKLSAEGYRFECIKEELL